MISQKEMLNIVATEAVESIAKPRQWSHLLRKETVSNFLVQVRNCGVWESVEGWKTMESAMENLSEWKAKNPLLEYRLIHETKTTEVIA